MNNPTPVTPAAAPATTQPASALSGVNILIEGPTGTGKTHSIGTIVDCGIDVFVLFTESGLETLLGYWTDKGKPVPPNLYWHVLDKPPGSFETLAKSAEMVNQFTAESLFKMVDPEKQKHNQFVTLLRALTNFTDQRTGKTFGPVDSWGPNRCLVLDSLTGINPIAMSLVIGGKAVRSQQDWGIAQDQIEKLLRQFTDGCRCHFVLTAHVEREIDQVFGGVKITVATLGKALAPKIPPMFSDVVLSYREGTRFLWSTANAQADLKARNLPIADGLPPDFAPIFAKWKSRGGLLTDKVQR